MSTRHIRPDLRRRRSRRRLDPRRAGALTHEFSIRDRIMHGAHPRPLTAAMGPCAAHGCTRSLASAQEARAVGAALRFQSVANSDRMFTAVALAASVCLESGYRV